MEVSVIRKVDLTMNEQTKYEIIKNLVETRGNKQRAAMKIGCTVRTVNRLIKAYELTGKAAFSHGNKGRKPVCALSTDLKETIICLYQNKYSPCNLRHFTELLARHENINVSEVSVRSILLKDNILSPRAHKSTKKYLRNKLLCEKSKSKSIKEKNKIQTALMHIEDSHPRRPRCQFFGEMIQMDASVHLWFGSTKTYLHAAVDDATGMIVGAYFDNQETLNGYYQVFNQILTNYGIPYMFYTDKRTVFEYKKRNSSKLEEDTFTQFSYACKQLGVDIKTTSIPQAKGRVERLFSTLQSRLPVELKLAGISTMEQANEFLNSYLKEFNERFALQPNCIKSVFEVQPSAHEIDLFLSVLTGRKVDSGQCIRFKNQYFKLYDAQGMLATFHKGTKVIVAETLSGKLYGCVGEQIFALEAVPKHEKASRNFDMPSEVAQEHKPKKKYIPPMNHPWKKENFQKYVYSMVGREIEWAS